MRRGRLALAVILAVVAGGGVLGLQVHAKAGGIQRDLDAARSLLVRAGGAQAGSAAQRLDLTRRAEGRTLAARGRLNDWPMRPLAAVPVLGRDVRAAGAVTDGALGVARAAGRVAATLDTAERRPGPRSLSATATALSDLSHELHDGAVKVQRARTLLAGGARERFLKAARSAENAALRAGQGLGILATLYGPTGSTRYFLAFQNPSELRGTGGLIGQYGILEASPTGPVVRKVQTLQTLQTRLRGAVPPPPGLAGRYGRLGVTSDWRSVNIPPDLPTVGKLIVAMYRRSTGERLDGAILVDPFVLAGILRISGPITVQGVRLGPGRVTRALLLDAYVRYPTDKEARRRFHSRVGLQAAAATRRALGARPVELIKALASAARGRHLTVYATDSTAQRTLLELGIGGSATAPPVGDYLMPVGVNAAANKLDSFLRRHVRYSVRLQPDGGARASASITLHNGAPSGGLPRYLIGPFNSRFQAGENRTLQSLYVAGAYGFTRAARDGRRVRVVTDEELHGLALTQDVSIQAGRSTTVAYDLVRHAAMQAEGSNFRYRLLLRPQATVNPDRLDVAVTAPDGWYFAELPPGFTGDGSVVRWSGKLDQERSLNFLLTSVE
jgi:Protein of unknown function (DUF4012)